MEGAGDEAVLEGTAPMQTLMHTGVGVGLHAVPSPSSGAEILIERARHGLNKRVFTGKLPDVWPGVL